MAQFDRLLQSQIAGQSGLVTRAQARGAGLTVGSPTALRGSCAAFAWGLTPSAPKTLEIVVPATRRGTSRRGVTVVRSRHALGRTHPTAWPHRTTVEHTVLDLSMGQGLDRFVSLAARALQRGLASESSLLEALSGRPNQTHRGLLVEALTDVGAGAESAAERRYIRDVERAHGLPEGRRQTPATGQRRRDNEYEGVGVVVEIDGRLAHADWAAQQRDSRRDRAAAVSGRLTVRDYWPDVAVTQARSPTSSAASSAFAVGPGRRIRAGDRDASWVERERPDPRVRLPAAQPGQPHTRAQPEHGSADVDRTPRRAGGSPLTAPGVRIRTCASTSTCSTTS